MNAYGYKDISSWMKDNKVPKGATKANARYLLELREMLDVYAKNNSMLYFLVTKLGLESCRTLLNSSIKQKMMIVAADKHLLKYAVTSEWVPVFKRNIDALKKRCGYIGTIIKENIWLTEYYPYFDSRDFDILLEFDKEFGDAELEYIVGDFEKFKEDHQDLIDKHMELVKPEIERHENFIKRRDEKQKEEKRYVREIERLEKAREKQIKKEVSKNDLKDKRMERSFEQYYK